MTRSWVEPISRRNHLAVNREGGSFLESMGGSLPASAKEGGEKNAKTILAAALAAAEKAAKKKLALAEVPAEIKTKVEERVKGLSAKK